MERRNRDILVFYGEVLKKTKKMETGMGSSCSVMDEVIGLYVKIREFLVFKYTVLPKARNKIK